MTSSTVRRGTRLKIASNSAWGRGSIIAYTLCRRSGVTRRPSLPRTAKSRAATDGGRRSSRDSALMADAREPDVGPDAGLGLQLGAQDAWMDLSLPGVVETLSDGVITTDETQTIVMANRAAKRMFGREDLIGLAIDALIPARFCDRHPPVPHYT